MEGGSAGPTTQQDPSDVSTTYCEIECIHWEVPEPLHQVYSGKGEWLAEFPSENPILVFWDHLIREINNTLEGRFEDPDKYNIPKQDSDRLRWAWERYTPKLFPYMDVTERCTRGTQHVPSWIVQVVPEMEVR